MSWTTYIKSSSVTSSWQMPKVNYNYHDLWHLFELIYVWQSPSYFCLCDNCRVYYSGHGRRRSRGDAPTLCWTFFGIYMLPVRVDQLNDLLNLPEDPAAVPAAAPAAADAPATADAPAAAADVPAADCGLMMFVAIVWTRTSSVQSMRHLSRCPTFENMIAFVPAVNCHSSWSFCMCSAGIHLSIRPVRMRPKRPGS